MANGQVWVESASPKQSEKLFACAGFSY